MRQQPDKEFDAKLREKMQGFSAEPPADLWGAIEKGIDQPAGKKGIVFPAWLKIAASVCLLAAAGLWFYNYERPLNNTIASGPLPGDSVSERERPGVTILNNSRKRDDPRLEMETEKEARQEKAIEKQPEEGLEVPEPGKSATPSGEGSEKPASGGSAVTVEALAALPEGKPAGQLQDAVAAGETTVPSGSASAGLSDSNPRAVAEPGLEDVTYNELQTLTQTDPLLAKAGEENDLAKISPLTLAASSPSETAGPPKDEKGSVEDDLHSGKDGAAGKNSLIPEEIREVSGVGEALNLMVSTIDRSEDKFIQVGRDERSGKWSGLSLDLGLVTISYNKPEKKRNEKNRSE